MNEKKNMIYNSLYVVEEHHEADILKRKGTISCPLNVTHLKNHESLSIQFELKYTDLRYN